MTKETEIQGLIDAAVEKALKAKASSIVQPGDENFSIPKYTTKGDAPAEVKKTQYEQWWQAGTVGLEAKVEDEPPFRVSWQMHRGDTVHTKWRTFNTKTTIEKAIAYLCRELMSIQKFNMPSQANPAIDVNAQSDNLEDEMLRESMKHGGPG